LLVGQCFEAELASADAAQVFTGARMQLRNGTTSFRARARLAIDREIARRRENLRNARDPIATADGNGNCQKILR